MRARLEQSLPLRRRDDTSWHSHGAAETSAPKIDVLPQAQACLEQAAERTAIVLAL